MLPKTRRVSRLLKERTEGVRARVFSNSDFRITVYPFSGPSVFSCAVAKKILPRAVDRNRTRRRLYTIVQELLPSIKNGNLCMVQVRTREVGGLDQVRLKESLMSLLMKAAVMD